MKIVLGLLIGFLMGISYFIILRIRVHYVFVKKYIYYIGWVLSISAFGIIFLMLNKHIDFDIISFFIGILLAQISAVSYSLVRSKE